ncbi:hypothetical protein BDA99DRAFT_497365 [Phascolomyces articulosus]|uniref:Heterokaryon incompatibility domain-containing protein n=1 Tax=Phascolomyces articulosus TaxID=60185 RepID=A0AAD5PHL0_9FUNG|nr:hypothetical protein BDA99DRAFT_497365 [Phascolomyces articulosus]
MYVTYEPRQFFQIQHRNHPGGNEFFRCNGPYDRAPKPVPNGLPKPDFMPSKLLRTSDMKIVDGSTVNEGYCALSYSWSWCGNNVMDTTKGKAVRVEEGKHKIIWPTKIVPKRPRGRKRLARTTKFVEFEGIIQQICKDFNVKYIWYDQWCIDQNNKEEKIREIKRMHKIYSNAYCSVAMIPELRAKKIKERNPRFPFRHYADPDAIASSDWFSRVWTLEEAIMSKKILFVGRNVHFWEDVAKGDSDFRALLKRPARLNVAMVLYHAHRRETTKEHDRMFALGNIFPGILDNLHANYHSPIEEAMIHFYGLLAKKDISILCFGEYEHYRFAILEREYWYKTVLPPSLMHWYNDVPIRKHNLPSWTGVSGEHRFCVDIDSLWKTSFKNYDINGRSMEITSSFVSSTSYKEGKGITLQYKDVPPLPTSNEDEWWNLAIKVQLSGHTKSKVLPLFNVLGGLDEIDYDELIESVTEKLQPLSHFFPIDKKRLFWRNSSKAPTNEYSRFVFNLTKDLSNPSSPQCTLLSGVAFEQKSDENLGLYPVIQKEQEGDHYYYRAIGTCEIDNAPYFFSDYSSSLEKTFIIQ